MNIYNQTGSIVKELNAIKRQLLDTQKLLKILLATDPKERKGKKLENYLLVQEVSDRLGLHVNTVYRYMREEGLPFTRVGRIRYIREDDVISLLERKTVWSNTVGKLNFYP